MTGVDREIGPDERVWKRCACCSRLFQAYRGEGWPEKPSWCGLGCWNSSRGWYRHNTQEAHLES
jgi:hypothetical protein